MPATPVVAVGMYRCMDPRRLSSLDEAMCRLRMDVVRDMTDLEDFKKADEFMVVVVIVMVWKEG